MSSLTDAFHENVQSALRSEVPDHKKRSNPVMMRPGVPVDADDAEDCYAPRRKAPYVKAAAKRRLPARATMVTYILIIVAALAIHAFAGAYMKSLAEGKGGYDQLTMLAVYAGAVAAYLLLARSV